MKKLLLTSLILLLSITTSYATCDTVSNYKKTMKNLLLTSLILLLSITTTYATCNTV